MADEGIFPNYPVAAWTVKGDRIVFVITKISEDGGNRLVERERPYRDGAKLDDTGSKARRWTIESVFENSIDEDGVPQNNQLYPFTLNALLASFDLHETGTLELPTRGSVRCRAGTYNRVEDNGERDCARVTFTFVQDNEDNVDAQSFQQPSVRSTIIRQAADTIFSMESLGGFSQFLADLESAASDLQDAIAAPGEALQDVDQKAARVVRICQNVENQMLVTGQLGRDLLTDPTAWAAGRQLATMRDRSARAAAEKSPGSKIATLVFQSTQSIFDIATSIGQSADDLMNLNTQLESFLEIPAGVLVRVVAP